MRKKRYVVKTKRVAAELDLTDFRSDLTGEVYDILGEMAEEILAAFNKALLRLQDGIYESDQAHTLIKIFISY